MLGSLLWPQMEIGWLLKASPLILVALGVETLLSARGGGRVKYDWLGMILCFLLVGAAMVFYAAAWAYENGEFINVRNPAAPTKPASAWITSFSTASTPTPSGWRPGTPWWAGSTPGTAGWRWKSATRTETPFWREPR